MLKRYNIIIIASVLLILTACQGYNTEVPVADEELISLSGVGELSVDANTRAAAGFYNEGRIGVVAAYYDAGGIDWTDYIDIRNAGATANTVSNGNYSFTWDSPKYWPFDNSSLVFLAYSPTAIGTNGVTLNADNTTLSLSLIENMPDVMYAFNNTSAAVTPYSKESNPNIVELGQFKHALSQLTVKVVADDSMNPNVRITSLSVATDYKTATLDLLSGDNGLVLGGIEAVSFDLVTSSTQFNNPSYEKTILLYPGTESSLVVTITLSDGPFSVNRNFTITDFEKGPGASDPIRLLRAKNTILTITVEGTSVEEPSNNIHLEGQISDWIDRGNFGTTIN